MPQNFTELWESYGELITQYGLRVLGAIAIILIGLRIAGWLSGLVKRTALKNEEIDDTLGTFFASIVRWFMTAAVFITAFQVCGGEATSFVAVLGAMTLAIGLAMQGALESKGIHTRVISAIPMDQICEPYIRRRAVRHLEKKRVVIFAAGTGNPYFTTDTAATLRASEMSCEAIFKGTKVDGVYDSDPVHNPEAVRYDTVSYDEVLQKNLKVMDASAIALARDNNLPIIVFSLDEPGGMAGVVEGRGQFTIVREAK